MANTITLRRRIRSVKNTKQITKAMELVSASKMRRAQESAVKSREYFLTAQELLNRLRKLTDVNKHPLFETRKIKTRLLVLVTSNRGLAGAYNSNMFKHFLAEVKEDQERGRATKVVVIGKQGARLVSRIEGVDVVASFNDLPEQPVPSDLVPLYRTLVRMYETAEIDAADILFTDYKSSISQVVASLRLLPAAFSEENIEDIEGEKDMFEPDPVMILNEVAPRLVEVQLWQAMLEAQASEQSMRMMAMKTATDNATDLIDDLTLEMNTARQAAITQELAEITGGVEAIK